MKRPNHNRILVLGTGNFGTCLAQHLAEKGFEVIAWTRSQHVAEHINQKRRNPKYLSTITLSERIYATSNIDKNIIGNCNCVVIAIPTQVIRQVLEQFSKVLPGEALIISAAKGIEVKSLEFPLGVLSSVLGENVAKRAVVLSGPSFASEVVNHQPTAVSLASFCNQSCLDAQKIVHTNYFRAYTSSDPIGLEVAGALKNVIAIAAGATIGLGYQQNSLAALLTRGLAEITRMGVALGANPITFNGLGGVGDLFLTCTSQKSRNFSVGYQLGKGLPLQKVIESLGSVAEGVTTSVSAYHLAQKISVDCPIVTEVYRVIHERKPIADAVVTLLNREAKPEFNLQLSSTV